MNVLFLVTDAYGGQGGIAYYNRCLAEALIDMPAVRRVTILPRVVGRVATEVPPKIEFVAHAAGSKLRYLRALAARGSKPCNLVICGHINLLPMAAAFSLLKRAKLVLQVHGIDVWQRPAILRRLSLRAVAAVWSVSEVTRDRMNSWARLPVGCYTIIPNTVQMEQYGLGPRRMDLVNRYGLLGKKVVLTLARLDSRERYKGIDEVLEALPKILQQEPSLCYLIAGDGDDRPRLAARARDLGVAGNVVFAGYVAESEKADLLRLADVFAMPGRGEGFGIVYLEAMACGVPVVGSWLDGSRDALKNGELGQLVNPDDPDSLRAGILSALQAPRRVPPGLADFGWPAFAARVSRALNPYVATAHGIA